MDALSLEQQLPFAFFTQAGSQQPPPQPQPPPPSPPVSQQQPPPPQVSVGLPQGGPLLPSASLTRGPQLPPLSVTVPSTLPQSSAENPGQPPMGIDATSVSLKGSRGTPWGSGWHCRSAYWRKGGTDRVTGPRLPSRISLSLKSGLGCAVRRRLEGDTWDADTG